VDRIVNAVRNEVSQHLRHPEHLIIHGHHDEARIRDSLTGGKPYTVTPVTGVSNPPWTCFV